MYWLEQYDILGKKVWAVMRWYQQKSERAKSWYQSARMRTPKLWKRKQEFAKSKFAANAKPQNSFLLSNHCMSY
jgi:hypothetical protein